MSRDSNELVKVINNWLKCSEFYPVYFNEFQKRMSEKRGQPMKNFHDLLRNEMTNSGAETMLRNKVYQVMSSIEKESYGAWLKDPIDYIRKAKVSWERRFYKPLNNLCFDLGIPFERKRNSVEQKEVESRWCELGSEEIDSSYVKPVYAPKDLLETLSRLRSPNQRTPIASKYVKWRLLQLPFKSVGFPTLKKKLAKVVNVPPLNVGLAEVYMDMADEQGQSMKMLFNERVKEAHHVCSWNYIPLLRAFALSGCSRGYRGHFWRHILCVHVGERERMYYENLKLSVVETDYMIDRLIIKDVKLTSSNDEQYFVFEEYLYQGQNSFDGRGAGWKDVVYLPNGIIPFHGFTMLACPLCYVYDDPVILYFVFKELYARYFFQLHNISSHPQGILRLSCLFEHLLEATEIELCDHFESFSIQPTRCVFKWLMRAFSGYLPTTQVLLLWDQIIALDSIEILPVVAVAILHFRKEVLMQAQTQDEIESLLSDLSSIAVIPVLYEYFSTMPENN